MVRPTECTAKLNELDPEGYLANILDLPQELIRCASCVRDFTRSSSWSMFFDQDCLTLVR